MPSLEPLAPAKDEEIGPASCVAPPDATKERDHQTKKEQSGKGSSHERTNDGPRDQAHNHTRRDDDSQAEMRRGQIGPEHLPERLALCPQISDIAFPGRLWISSRPLRPLHYYHPPFRSTGA